MFQRRAADALEAFEVPARKSAPHRDVVSVARASVADDRHGDACHAMIAEASLAPPGASRGDETLWPARNGGIFSVPRTLM